MAGSAITPPAGYQLEDSSSGVTPPPGYVMEQPMGGLESFGRGVANNIPLVPQAIAGLSPDYSKGLKEWNANAAAAKAQNPVSYGAGAVAGAAAPLAIPGVGEALEASPVLTNAALGAANAISNTDLKEQPKEALKEGLEGAGIGAGLGSVGKALAPAGKALEEGAAGLEGKAMNLRPGRLGRMSSEDLADVGHFARQIGATDTDTERAITNAHMAQKAVGDEIKRIGAGATPVGDISEFTAPLTEKAEQVAKMSAPEAKMELNTYRAGNTDLAQAKTWDDLALLKQKYGSWAFSPDHTVKNAAAADVYSQISDAMKKAVSNAPEKYQSALKRYTMTHDIIDGLTKKLGSERTVSPSGSLMSTMRKLPAPMRAVVGGAATAAGHPYLGGMAALPEIANPLNQATALRTIPKAGKALVPEMNDFFASQLRRDNNEDER